MGTIGRFAPSPTGPLHIGNLRTALASWLDARSETGRWLVRFEDLDQIVSSDRWSSDQLDDLARLQMVPDEAPLWQSADIAPYRAAIDELVAQGLTYPCFCTRREIRDAIAASASAPNRPDRVLYPGTCSTLTDAEQRLRAGERPGAIRFRSSVPDAVVHDEFRGRLTFPVDDFVILRSDGVPAYNLVVVVDDHRTGITSIVRADDLLASSARQMLLQEALGYSVPRYRHVPLVVNTDGVRLAKRDGAVTLAELDELGMSPRAVLDELLRSMGLAGDGERIGLDEAIVRWGRNVDPGAWANVFTERESGFGLTSAAPGPSGPPAAAP